MPGRPKALAPPAPCRPSRAVGNGGGSRSRGHKIRRRQGLSLGVGLPDLSGDMFLKTLAVLVSDDTAARRYGNAPILAKEKSQGTTDRTSRSLTRDQRPGAGRIGCNFA